MKWWRKSWKPKFWSCLRLGVREVMRKLLDNEALTDSETVLLREPYAIEYLMRTLPEIAAGRELPLMRRLDHAQSREEKAVIIGGEPARLKRTEPDIHPKVRV